jgi:hypothetical protein
MAGGELRLGTTSMYMTTYITRFDANQDKNINLHGYILGSERKLIAQNQALERVNRGKFSLTFPIFTMTNVESTPAIRLPIRPQFAMSDIRVAVSSDGSENGHMPQFSTTGAEATCSRGGIVDNNTACEAGFGGIGVLCDGAQKLASMTQRRNSDFLQVLICQLG